MKSKLSELKASLAIQRTRMDHVEGMATDLIALRHRIIMDEKNVIPMEKITAHIHELRREVAKVL